MGKTPTIPANKNYEWRNFELEELKTQISLLLDLRNKLAHYKPITRKEFDQLILTIENMQLNRIRDSFWLGVSFHLQQLEWISIKTLNDFEALPHFPNSLIYISYMFEKKGGSPL